MVVQGLIAGYRPSTFTGEVTPEAILSYLERELLAIARTFAEVTEVELRPIFAAPSKPREGMIVFADGTLWNPGAGKGLYVYKGTTWTHIV